MGFWCQRSGGWWRQLCLGEQMNLSEPLLEPSVDGSSLPLTQRWLLNRREAELSSIANFIKCVRGHKCLHAHFHVCMLLLLLLLQEEVFLSCGSRWSKLAPICASHVLPLHSRHRAKHPFFFHKINAWQTLKNPKGHLTKHLLLWRYFQNRRPSGWQKYSSCCPIKQIFSMCGPRNIKPTDCVDPLIVPLAPTWGWRQRFRVKYVDK